MNIFDYTQDTIYFYYEKQITTLLAENKKKEAQKKAFEWLQEYVVPLCISVPWNWKIAKKQIAAYYYGKTPSVHLYFEDTVEKGIYFIQSHAEQNIRCSFHRFNAACHSESHRITNKNFDWLVEIKKRMSPKDVIDIFTECSTTSTTCFRRFSLPYNEEISYEMGYGQAMYAFEAERGQHDVVGGNYSGGKWRLENTSNGKLTGCLEELIRNHEQYLAIKAQCICYYLGIPQLSIEGYFDTMNPTKKPIIVDIDLPFDKVFFERKEYD